MESISHALRDLLERMGGQAPVSAIRVPHVTPAAKVLFFAPKKKK